jgi:3-hydroxyisobutyrate dehydrogenase
VSEALVAAEKFGIDPHVANQVLNASTGRNNTTDVKVEAFMLSKRYDSGFALALMRKDIETAAHFIDGVATRGAFARNCLAIASAAEKALGAGADHTAVHKYVAGKT